MQIYQIYNKNTGKSYVGQSANYIKRYEVHKRAASNHKNGRLYASMIHHGVEAFELRLVEEVSTQAANAREMFWIAELNTMVPSGYNMTQCSDSSKQKMFEAAKRRAPCSLETRQKISEVVKGRAPRSLETRRKISENNIRLQVEGKIGMRGRKHSTNTKQKMRENNAMNNPIHVKKVKDAKRGIQYLNQNGKRMMAVPNTEKWNKLISLGYEIGY